MKSFGQRVIKDILLIYYLSTFLQCVFVAVEKKKKEKILGPYSPKYGKNRKKNINNHLIIHAIMLHFTFFPKVFIHIISFEVHDYM